MDDESGLGYVEFGYLQPVALEKRNVDWLDEDVSTLVLCGHGTYWEALQWILGGGSLAPSARVGFPWLVDLVFA